MIYDIMVEKKKREKVVPAVSRHFYIPINIRAWEFRK
jgi:hypothetical protein